MTIGLSNYKGRPVLEEKTEQSKSYRSTPLFASTDIKIEDVPINKNLNAVSMILQEGDKNPFYFISEMKFGEKHPTVYGEVMTKEWAESFIEKLNKAPFPISAFGHVNMSDPWERKANQGYVLGGKVDEEKESMFLLNYLRNGEEDTPETKQIFQSTKRELRSGMLSTSISNVQRYIRTYDESTDEDKWYVVESINGQRNDIVEHDLTGADAAIVAQSFKKAENKSANTPKGESMNKEEMLKRLQTLKKNGELSVAELADNLGLELVSEEHTNAQASLKAIQAEAGEGVDVLTIVKEYKTLKDKLVTAEFDNLKSAALKEAFKNEDIRAYAEELFSLKSGSKEEIDAEVKKICESKILKDLASKMAGELTKKTSFKVDNTEVKTSAEPVVM